MKIALVQVSSPDGESLARRADRVFASVDAIDPGVDLIVLPELWHVGYNHFADYESAATTVGSEIVRQFAAIAARRRAFVSIGSLVERTADGALRNTSVLLDDFGKVVHTYSKVHVFGYQSMEAGILTRGDSIGSVATRYGHIASTTCYDLRFPGMWSELGRIGAELVIVPAAWPERRVDHWRHLTTARALDNQVFVLACNASGSHGGVRLAGRSRIIDPWGRVVVEGGADESVVQAEIEPSLVQTTRTEFPVLADSLADYSILTTRKVSA